MRFKTLRGSLEGKIQRGQYLLAVGLGGYKWYQSQTPDDVSARRLSPEGGGHEVVCQQGRWALKGVDWRVPHRLEKGTSASENVGPKGGWIIRSHIDWGGKRSILYKGVKTSP